MGYVNPSFEILWQEYNDLRKNENNRQKSLSEIKRQLNIAVPKDFHGDFMEAYEKLEEKYRMMREHEEARFEEMLKDPSKLRGRTMGASYGILDAEPATDDFGDLWEDESEEAVPDLSPVPIRRIRVVDESDDLPF